MTLGAGEQFAGYTIVRQLGSGGMGVVYLAQHPRLPRRDALKVLLPDISQDSTFRQRFIREADSIAALEHPRIVTVYDRGDTDGHLWIATQYVDGTDAARLLRERYPAGAPTDEVAQIVTAIAQALDHAHARGVLHRDVKPANILLTHPDSDGLRRIYLADFGIARPLNDPAGLTETAMFIGTFAYAAPEQLLGEPVDGRADQYALAATAYHLLTGTTPFPDANPVAAIGHHLTTTPTPPSRFNRTLAPFDAAFARALSKDPADRYPRCQDFARAIESAAAAGGMASPTAPTQQAPVRPAPHKSNRTALSFGAIIVFLAAAAFFLLGTRSNGGSPPQSQPAAPSLTVTTTAPIAAPTSLPPPPPAATPTITTETTTSTAAVQRYALPGCYTGTDDAGLTERPAESPLRCRHQWFSDLAWTSWGPSGAEGTGIEEQKNCFPSCAQGENFRNRVQLLFTGSQPAPPESSCPNTFRYYSQLIVAYPNLTAVPQGLAYTGIPERYNGMPALRYNDLELLCTTGHN